MEDEMARYDYFCEANQRVVEVSHSMKDAALATWGEVCDRAGLEPGETPATAPVRRLVTGGSGLMLRANGEGPAAWNDAARSCGMGCGCHGDN
jgi:hypothetical protein